MSSRTRLILFLLTACAGLGLASSPASAERTAILKTREAVWRAWFAGDLDVLRKLVPPESISIGAGDTKWKTQPEILQEAAAFHRQGGKLLLLQFPHEQLQRFGDVAIVYSEFLLETEVSGRRSRRSGLATEIFVLRHGLWLNPGWQTSSQ